MTKRILSFLLSFTIILGLFYGANLSVFAEDTPAEAFEYTVNEDGETVTITKYIGDFTEVVIPSTIDGKDVTVIGFNSFSGCSTLNSITLPDTITSIDGSAIYYCKKLTSINVDENNPYFSSYDGILFNKNNTALIRYPEGKPNITYTIPNTIISIGNSAFENCTNLTNITISESVKEIGSNVFENCSSLTEIIIPNSVTSIGEFAFNGCSNLKNITLSENIPAINDGVFLDCSALTSITIPDSVTSIGTCAFQECTNLTNITMSDNITSIGVCAFAICDNLEKIDLPEKLTSIGDSAFCDCDLLANITLPASVTSIGEAPFVLCDNLTNINVSDENAYYSSIDGVLLNKEQTSIIVYPTGKIESPYIVPNTVTTIENNAFAYCSNLTSIITSTALTTIGDNAFADCSNLTDITLYDNLESIGNEAFDDCTALENVYYLGTKEDWDLISVDYGNTYLLNANRYYGASGEEDIKQFDVMASAIGCSQSAIADGEEVSFYTTIRNIGDNATVGAVKVDFYLDGQLIESKTVTDNIESGRSLVVYTTDSSPAIFGSHTVKVMVSLDNTTLDTDDGNNTKKSRFLVD